MANNNRKQPDDQALSWDVSTAAERQAQGALLRKQLEQLEESPRLVTLEELKSRLDYIHSEVPDPDEARHEAMWALARFINDDEVTLKLRDL